LIKLDKISYIPLGISTGCTYIASLIVIPEYFDKKIGIANGIVMAGSGVGSFFVPNSFFGMRYFIQTYDWKFTISICASSILLCCGLGALLKPLNPPETSSPSFDKAEKKKM
jgi:MFS family permease